MPDPTPIDRLRAYCKGREQEQSPAGAVARFFQNAAVTQFATLDDLRTAVRHHGPHTTHAEIAAAIAAAGLAPQA
jgi:hypothetical protein